MEKKNIDWGSIGFGYIPTDYRYVANFKDGKWDEGTLTTDPNVTLNECACVFQYAQTVFEGMKAYTTYRNIPSGPQRRASCKFCKKTGNAGIPGRSFR